MEKKVETTISILGIYGDNGKGNGNPEMRACPWV